MNKRVIIEYIFCIVFASFLFSCKDKTVDYGLDTYYVEMVTAWNENEFLSDNGNMIIAASDENKRTYAFGDRVLLNYTLLSTSASGDYSVRINGSAKIPQGNLTLSDAAAINSSPEDPILLESVWLGSHYLNMQFYLNYKSEAHKIGLLADSTRMESDTLRLYFIHDTNNDPPGYPIHTYLSFDLKDVLGDPGKSRLLSVQINTDNYGNKSYAFEY
ncbi:MAG: hypothetical protein FWF53_06285 [Candidatus Azobacteroides sp.]|nr:hypothetical protein [Candidatus Azobacteroides sp.]